MNADQNKAFNFIKKGYNTLITAPAGYGKSYLITEIYIWASQNNKNIGITALTGSAAIIINGYSLHSFLGINLGLEDAKTLYQKSKYKNKLINKLKYLHILIIDEISMMNNELFDKIDDYLQLIRNNNKPFGGIQIILFGDFAQIEPVKGKYCFLSDRWNTNITDIIQLTENMRQTELEFQKILNEIRFANKNLTEDTYNKILSLRNTTFEDCIKPTKICSLNCDVNTINKKEFEIISKDKTIYKYKCLDQKTELELCIGANIILTYNLDFENKLINGSRGICIALDDRSVTIKFMNNNIATIGYINYYPDETNKKIYREYIPLILGYAITIHKSQGMTIDAMEINLDGIFADGQAYVLFSRAKNLKSIKIQNSIICKSVFHSNKLVREFYNKLKM